MCCTLLIYALNIENELFFQGSFLVIQIKLPFNFGLVCFITSTVVTLSACWNTDLVLENFGVRDWVLVGAGSRG